MQTARSSLICTKAFVLIRSRELQALDLGKATLGKIRQNLGWALVYNVIGIPVAAGILLPSTGFALSPSLAGALMAFSSVSVVLNSVMLRYTQRNVEGRLTVETVADQRTVSQPT
jgi:P-type Cu2+ transporter